MSECLFCKIAEHQIPAKIVYEDTTALAIEDINPKAPVHLLVIPRQHIVSLYEMKQEDENLIGHLHAIAAQLARERGLETQGYRTVINSGEGAGQSVFHLHVHVLGGRLFQWPPG
ncbi:MAG: histidine triad nucleotide-binding protein [Terriglobia bacterium]